MPSLQDWVNRWVHVNNKSSSTYRFPDEEELAGRRHVQVRHVPSLSAAPSSAGSDGAAAADDATNEKTAGGSTSHRCSLDSSLATTTDVDDSPDARRRLPPGGSEHDAEYDDDGRYYNRRGHDRYHRHHRSSYRGGGGGSASSSSVMTSPSSSARLTCIRLGGCAARRRHQSSGNSGRNRSWLVKGGEDVEAAGDNSHDSRHRARIREKSNSDLSRTSATRRSSFGGGSRASGGGGSGPPSVVGGPDDSYRSSRSREKGESGGAESMGRMTTGGEGATHDANRNNASSPVSHAMLGNRPAAMNPPSAAAPLTSPPRHGRNNSRVRGRASLLRGRHYEHATQSFGHAVYSPGAGASYRQPSSSWRRAADQRHYQLHPPPPPPPPSSPGHVRASVSPPGTAVSPAVHVSPQHSADSSTPVTAVSHLVTDAGKAGPGNLSPQQQQRPRPKKPPDDGGAGTGAGTGGGGGAKHAATASGDCQGCDKCQAMEKAMMLMQSDIEYLRSMAVASERSHHTEERRNGVAAKHASVMCTCRRDNNLVPSASVGGGGTAASSHASPSHQRKALTPPPPPPCPVHGSTGTAANDGPSLRDLSQRLVEVTARHKGQIEQMTRERARWQHSLQLKTSKFALMCKDLNEESAIRKQDTVALEKELSEVQADRNALAAELDAHPIRLDRCTRSEEDNERLRAAVIERDREMMQELEVAISRRDRIIEELSRRLQVTMATLQTERERHRQRRQIIFPTSRPQIERGMHEQLSQAREDAREARASLEGFKGAAMKREEELQAKNQAMARQLRVAERRLLLAGCSPTSL